MYHERETRIRENYHKTHSANTLKLLWWVDPSRKKSLAATISSLNLKALVLTFQWRPTPDAKSQEEGATYLRRGYGPPGHASQNLS